MAKRGIIASLLADTNWHVGVLSTDDDRRHKSRCVYYDKKTKKCESAASPYYERYCGGSAHCDVYYEKEEILQPATIQPIPKKIENPKPILASSQITARVKEEGNKNMNNGAFAHAVKKNCPSISKPMAESISSLIENYNRAKDEILI